MIQVPFDLEVEEINGVVDLEVDSKVACSYAYKHVFHSEHNYPFLRTLGPNVTGACGTRTLPRYCYTSDKIVYIKTRDTKGRRPGFWFGCDIFVINEKPANNEDTNLNNQIIIRSYYIDNESKIKIIEGQFGLYVNNLYLADNQSKAGIRVFAKRNEEFALDDSLYLIDVYLLDWPDNKSPFKDNE